MNNTVIPFADNQSWPDKPAYIMASSGETVTYAELERTSNQIAWLFRQSGLKSGDHIAFLMENNASFFKLCWAAHRSGIYYTPISSSLQEKEIAYIAKDCGARIFITSYAQAELANKLLAELESLPHLYMLGGVIDGYEALEAALEGLPETVIEDQMEGLDMLYSSGTTGLPKGVKRPERLEEFGSPEPLHNMISKMYGLNVKSVYLSTAPCYHAASLRFNLFVQRHGGTCIVMEKFDAEQALQLIERYRITVSQWVPTMFVRLLKLPQEVRESYDYSSMLNAVHAAAPCPAAIKQQMIDWWGPIIDEYYGGTEGTEVTCLNSEEWLQHRGSVGRPVLGVIRICDDDGNELPQGETGGVYFDSPLSFEYHNDPIKTRQAMHAKGWSTLGDIGHLDSDGFLYLSDRKAFMIISGGVNIYPQEIENLLITHAAVMDVAVIGIPNQEFGEEVKAIIQPVDMAQAGSMLAEELMQLCRDNLSHIKCPRSIDFDPALPRQPTGKLFKRLLKEKYWS